MYLTLYYLANAQLCNIGTAARNGVKTGFKNGHSHLSGPFLSSVVWPMQLCCYGYILGHFAVDLCVHIYILCPSRCGLPIGFA